jgi:hypothetical protein
MMPLLIDRTVRAFSASSVRIPPGGHRAMQPDVIMPMIYFLF